MVKSDATVNCVSKKKNKPTQRQTFWYSTHYHKQISIWLDSCFGFELNEVKCAVTAIIPVKNS